jgi:hypothetical protein
MNLRFMKMTSPLQIFLLVIFVIYIVFPIKFPDFISNWIDSSLGMIVIFAITLFLFCYVNPILGVLYVFVAYELIRRSSNATGKMAYIRHISSQRKKDAEMKAMNPPAEITLEETIVSKMAPIGHSDKSVYINTTFKPVSENDHNAFAV